MKRVLIVCNRLAPAIELDYVAGSLSESHKLAPVVLLSSAELESKLPAGALAAVALGATVIKKHMTFSRHMYGSDASHSAEPSQFMDLARGVREISVMLDNLVIKVVSANSFLNVFLWFGGNGHDMNIAVRFRCGVTCVVNTPFD